jgi:hypothetical protein
MNTVVTQMPQPGILAVLPMSPVQNPSADFLQSSLLLYNSPVSFKPVNLFYSQNVPFDIIMKRKHKIFPPGCVREFFDFRHLTLIENHKIGHQIFLLWCWVEAWLKLGHRQSRGSGDSNHERKGIKGFPTQTLPAEP